jgi:hypothetical protein
LLGREDRDSHGPRFTPTKPRPEQGFGNRCSIFLIAAKEGRMTGALRSGEWLTASRARRVAIACLALAIASLVLLFATAHGTLDWRGRPVGTDFSEVYAAGQMVWDGAATKVWDWPSHFRVQ